MIKINDKEFIEKSGGTAVTHVDLDGNAIFGVTTGGSGGMAVTEVDTNGNYVDLSPSGGGGAVDSVNGQTGDVILIASDVDAFDKIESDARYLQDSDLNNALTIDLATMNTPQPLTTTPTELLIESNSDNLFTFDASEHSFMPKIDGTYEAKIQLNVTATSNGSVFKSGFDANGVIFQGEEQSVDSGNSILTFNVLLPQSTTSNEYKFLVEEDGAGVITINSARVYFEKKVVL